MSSGKQCNSSYLTALKSPDSKFSCCFVRFWICKEPLYMFQWCDCIFSIWGCQWDRFGILSHLTMGQFGDASPSVIGWQISGSKLVPKNCRLVSSVQWESVGLLSGRSWVQTPAGPTLRVFKWLRRKCCPCNDIYKWLDFLLFSDKDEKL